MPHAKRRIVTALMVLGLLLLQSAWVLVVPPFGAADEFDHAYRASAAAHGELFTELGRPEDGRGLLITVDDGIAEAARPQCEVLEYPGPDNCVPVADRGDGMVAIASAAAIYQPTYYLSVGWVTHVLDGFAALYAMRIVSAVLCAALFGLAVWMITGWAKSVWPLMAAIVTLTPTALYTVSVLAPNGLEMMLGLALWSCLIGAARTADVGQRRRSLMVAVPIACLFAWVRPFSPIWLFLIILAWLSLLGVCGVRDLLRNHTRLMLSAAVLIALSALTSTHWVLTHSSGEPPDSYDIEGSRWGQTLEEVPLWFLQVISGVPFRNTPATFDVYMAGLVLFTFVLVPLARCRTPRVRLAAFVAVLGSLTVAAWYTYSQLPTFGAVWQGRYVWCVALGVVILAGVALEDRRLEVTKTLGLVFGIPALLLMHLRCLQFVLEIENRESPLRGEEWISAPIGVVLCLATVGLMTWLSAARMAMSTTLPTPFSRQAPRSRTSESASAPESIT